MLVETRKVELVNAPTYEDVLNTFNIAARNCYQSLNSNTDNKEEAEKLAEKLIKIGHGSPIEMNNITFHIVADRSFLGQLSRHRLLSLAVESARYCNYSKDKFGDSVTFIKPVDIKTKEQEEIWKKACSDSEKAYFRLLDEGCKPETARSVLNSSLQTSIIASTNIREWRHILKLRCDNHAQVDFREIATTILKILYNKYPIFFRDLYNEFIEEVKH